MKGTGPIATLWDNLAANALGTSYFSFTVANSGVFVRNLEKLKCRDYENRSQQLINGAR